MKVRHNNLNNLTRTLSLTQCDPPPLPLKNPGHHPEEEKEIAELSKRGSTRSVQRLSQQKKKQNSYSIPFYPL